MVFRRRGRHAEDAQRPGYYADDDFDDRDSWSEPGEEAEAGEAEDDPDDFDAVAPGGGPWDAAEPYPRRTVRVDCGSLLVPVSADLEIRLNMLEAAETSLGVSVDVVLTGPRGGVSVLQLQAFAAPKSSGLWDDVRQEIAEEVAKSGGRSEEAPGPFGTELHAIVGGEGRSQLEPQRILGVDGPRWFLRGVILGPAATDPGLARPFEDLLADVVVVRGDHPMPPRESLPLRLPEEARRALEEQVLQPPDGPNPFDRA